MNKGMAILSEATVHSKYARYLDNLKRREVFSEIVDRNMQMHLDKFPHLETEINTAYKLVYRKEVLPSMRGMQFAGPAIATNNTRLFNCSYIPCDNYRCFSETMFMLLSGTGVGYSVEQINLNQLPAIVKPALSQKYVIEDSIMGWAESVRMLFKAYFFGNALPLYDYSGIRHKGERLITSGGRAPGAAPLRAALNSIKRILNASVGRQLTSLEVHSVLCIIADSVLSGGIRRCLPEGSRVHTKYGMKRIEDVNIGDLVLTSNGYENVKKKFYQGIQNLVRVHTQDSYFDCTPNHKIAVLTGQDVYTWKQAQELTDKDRIIAPSIKIEGIRQNLPLFSYSKPEKSTTCKDIIIPELDKDMAWLLGLIQGDGCVYLTSKSGYVSVACNKEFPDLITKVHQELQKFGINTHQNEYANHTTVVAKSKQLATYLQSWLKKPKITLHIPEFLWDAPQEIKISFLSGLMDADGSVKNRPATLCVSVYKEYCEEIRLLLSSCGLQGRLKKLSETNLKENWQKKYAVVLINNKTTEAFANSLFKIPTVSSIEQRTNSYPKEWLTFSYPNNYPWSKTNNKLIPVQIVGIETLEIPKKTWDIEVESAHEFFCEGYLMHNSAMIAFFDKDDELMATCKHGEWWVERPYLGRANNSMVAFRDSFTQEDFKRYFKWLQDSKSGEPGIFWTNPGSMRTNPCSEAALEPFSFCNLTTINASIITTQDQYNQAAWAAAFIGTLQASYTDFHYLRPCWKEATEKDALIGVGSTGVATRAFLTLDHTEAAKVVVETNRYFAELIGINQAARCTLQKPDGTTSIVLASSSGVHSWHDQWWVRRIRVGKHEAIYKFFQKHLFNFLEDDVEKPELQAILSIPCEAPAAAITRNESAIDLLTRVKKFYNEWVYPGHNRGENTHSISVTVSVKDNEWDEVGAWMWNNRDNYAGISVLPFDGGTYRQAPFESITKQQYLEMSALLPTNLDFTQVIELDDNTSLQGEVSCSGGACLI